MAMIEDLNLLNYRPLFVINDTGVMKYAEPKAGFGGAR